MNSSNHVLLQLASVVLAFHVGVGLFNLFGLIAIPLGGWRGWSFVRVFWWRALHLAILAVVALQALLGRACFLTIWQSALEGAAGLPRLAIGGWVSRLIFWPLPLSFFAALYSAVWIYALLLWRFVPPALPGRVFILPRLSPPG